MTSTVLEALRSAASVTDRGFTFLDGSLNGDLTSFKALLELAERRGQQLLAKGLEPGDRLGLVVPDNDHFVLTFLGAITVGIVPVPMYPPLALGKLDSYLDTAARILKSSGARALVTTKKVSPILWTLLDRVDTLEDIHLVQKLEETAPANKNVAPPKPEDPCFLQFTSGSTSDPKGVVVSHANLIANAKAIMYDGLKSDPEVDKGVTWLPLYHDMGLIGFVIAPVLATVSVVFIPTLSFVKRPTVWMDTVNKHRGTLTFAPNFAFALSARRAHRQVNNDNFDLSCLRVVGCGAEPINPETIRKFTDAYAPANLSERAIMPCYGMAEATLAMAFEPLDEPMHTTRIDRETYENENVARAAKAGEEDTLELVACGRTFPEHGLAIRGDDGELLSDGNVGEIVFKGPSTTAGYFGNAEATSKTLRDGWLHTGDLGFMMNGRVYISGRKKDLIILNGRNYHPQAIEWEVEQVTGVRKGNVVSFAVRGTTTEKLVVVAESKSEDREAISEQVRKRVNETLGLKVDEAVIVPAGSLPKTSSGKLQRRKTRSEYQSKTLGQGNRTMGNKNVARAKLARHITAGFFTRIRHRVRRVLPASALGFASSRREARRR